MMFIFDPSLPSPRHGASHHLHRDNASYNLNPARAAAASIPRSKNEEPEPTRPGLLHAVALRHHHDDHDASLRPHRHNPSPHRFQPSRMRGLTTSGRLDQHEGVPAQIPSRLQPLVASPHVMSIT
eukprot:2959409-Rhodomonas_salina.1